MCACMCLGVSPHMTRVVRLIFFCACVKGFKYLYLRPDDFKKVSTMNSVRAELIEDQGESRYKITDIIGMGRFFTLDTLYIDSSLRTLYKTLVVHHSNQEDWCVVTVTDKQEGGM